MRSQEPTTLHEAKNTVTAEFPVPLCRRRGVVLRVERGRGGNVDGSSAMRERDERAAVTLPYHVGTDAAEPQRAD